MARQSAHDVVLITLFLTLLCPIKSLARSSESDAPTSPPAEPADARSLGNQVHDPPFVDSNPLKSPGDLSAPFPVPVPKDLPRRVPLRAGISVNRQSATTADLIQQIDEPMVLGYLQDITFFGPRVTEGGDCQAAGDYLYNEFQAMQLDVRYHYWSYGGRQDRNIEATLHGSDPSSNEVYLVCAHYDSVPGSPGADDNGSGVAAVLSAAYIMSQYTTEHTVRFVAFSGEEQGLLGSHEYAADAYAAGDNIVATLNADMIGFAAAAGSDAYVKVFANSPSMWLSDYTANIGALYQAYIDLTVIPSGTTSGSDHWYFWSYGYDGLFYHEFDFNDYYHSPQDLVSNMDLAYDVKVTRLVFATLAELAVLNKMVETDPPTPNPMLFDTPPMAFDQSWIAMTATTATDSSPPVEYKFDEISGAGNSSGWQESTSYSDTALSANMQCQYTVRARDSSTTQNETAASGPTSAYTLAYTPLSPSVSGETLTTINVDPTAGDNPAHTELTIHVESSDSNWNQMFVGASGNPSASKVWQNDLAWDTIVVQGLRPGTDYAFDVQARNGDGIETYYSSPSTGTTEGSIPTVSEWGLVATACLLLVGGTLVFGRGRLSSLA